MFLIGVIKPIKENKFKGGGGDLRAYQIKLVLFLYAVGLLHGGNKTLHTKKEKYYYI